MSLLVLCFLLLQPAIDPPYSVEFITGGFDHERGLVKHEQLMSRLPEGYVRKASTAALVHKGYFRSSGDFVPNAGRAMYKSEAGYESITFLELPDQAAFKLFIENEMKLVGPDPDVGDFGNRVTIQGKPRTEMVTVQGKRMDSDGRVTVYTEEVEEKTTYGKAHIAYHDGISVGGSELAFRIDGGDLLEDVKQGRGWDSGKITYPQRLDRAGRVSGIEHWAAVKAAQVQRRDGEQEWTFAVRNSLLSLHHEYRERFWLDVATSKWFTIEPTESKPEWTFRLSATSVPGTVLAKQFRELRQVSVPEIKIDGTPILKVSLGARLPEIYCELLKPLVGQVTADDSLVRTTALQLLESGRLAGQAVVFLDANDEIVVNAVGSLRGESLPIEALQASFGGTVAGQVAQIPLPVHYGEWNLPLSAVADVEDSRLRLAIGRSETVASKLPSVEDGTNSRGVLLSISGDLSPLLDLPDEHPSVEIVKQMEVLHHLFRLPTLAAGEMTDKAKRRQDRNLRFGRWQPNLSNFDGILDKFSAEEDWSFDLKVKTDSRGQLVVDAKVGLGLLTYWRCRRYMSRGPRE